MVQAEQHAVGCGEGVGVLQPDAPGLWRFRGLIRYRHSTYPVRMTVRVFWGSVSQGWHTEDMAGRLGRRPATMMVGTWTLIRGI